jgi:hypothetical protein
MTTVHEHIRQAHPVKGYFRNGTWINGYIMPKCVISTHLRRI